MVDYTLYLVTDSTPGILGDRDLTEVVREAIAGGVTIVQYRVKNTATLTMIQEASALLSVCRAANVPLLINDRLDVALAIDADGVHIGQDDIPLSTARSLLGPNKIIGVTAMNTTEALAACRDGADYLGIGTVFATKTKTDTKGIIGISGVREILADMEMAGFENVATVCIGGVNAGNVSRVIHQARTPTKSLDGVALVSAIIAAESPKDASALLYKAITTPPLSALPTRAFSSNIATLLAGIPDVWRRVAEKKPLSHNMTNQVVQNFAANVALAVGASPIMSLNGAEAGDLARLGGALVINMGTATDEAIENYVKAGSEYNALGRPIVFDPVARAHIRPPSSPQRTSFPESTSPY